MAARLTNIKFDPYLSYAENAKINEISKSGMHKWCKRHNLKNIPKAKPKKIIYNDPSVRLVYKVKESKHSLNTNELKIKAWRLITKDLTVSKYVGYWASKLWMKYNNMQYWSHLEDIRLWTWILVSRCWDPSKYTLEVIICLCAKKAYYYMLELRSGKK